MADTQQIYFTTLTAIGEAKDANAKALGTALKFTEMAVGDGNGALPVPDKNRTALVRQVRRAPLNTLKADPANPGQVIAEQIIPEDVGGWWIRELGLYDDAGDLVAIGNCPETYKPQLAQGSGRTQVVRMVLIMSSAATVQLKVDPAVVLATRKYVDDQDAQARQAAADQDAAHVAALDPHPQYMTDAETTVKIAAAIAGKADLAGATFTGPVTLSADTPALGLSCTKRVIGGDIGTIKLFSDIASASRWAGMRGFIPAGSAGIDFTALAIHTNNGADNNAARMTVTPPGNVLIGTSSDSGAEKLQVNGNLAAYGTARFGRNDYGWGNREQNVLSLLGDGVSSVYPPSQFRFYTTPGYINSYGGNAKLTLRAWDATAGEVDLLTFNNGNVLAGATTGVCHVFNKAVPQGTMLFSVGSSTTGQNSFIAFGVSDQVFNSAATSIGVSRNTTTGRSINAAGTINASGADYAEYMTKADSCAVIEKGAIVGIDANGKLTDKYAGAVSFLIKSTDPSYVGGDAWSRSDALGQSRPVTPQLEHTPYVGAADPGPEPVAPVAPAAPAEPADLVPPAAPAEDATDAALAAYHVLFTLYKAATQERAEQYQLAVAEHAAALTLYQQQLAKYTQDKAAYDIAVVAFQADQAAYAEKVESERLYFDAITMPAYQAELAKFEQVLETARQRVDRMAYCGQVPVNVTGAKPGQYVVPLQDGEGIAGQLVDADAITFDQYRRAVGIVQNILPDGRANVRVKPV